MSVSLAALECFRSYYKEAFWFRQRSLYFDKRGYRIGFIGLIEHEWLAVLPMPTDDLIYEDFIEYEKRYSKNLREEQKCDLVIALTHMRNKNDKKLAKEFAGLDLILGGHGHMRWIQNINGTYCIKSNCEFKEFTKITLTPQKNPCEELYKEKFLVDIESIEITKKLDPDPCLKQHVERYQEILQEKMCSDIGFTEVELEIRFRYIRTAEQPITNFISDVIRAFTGAEIMLLNSGAIRSDYIIPSGYLKLKDLITILPNVDLVRIMRITGEVLYKYWKIPFLSIHSLKENFLHFWESNLRSILRKNS